MADIPVATGSLPDGTSFQFFLDGVATYKQNERLIAKMDALVKRFKAEEHDISHSNKVREEETDLIEQGNKKTEEYHDALTDLRKETLNIHLATELLRGNFKALMYASSDTSNKLIALGAVSSGLMGMVGALTGYSDKMGLAMQRGVSGGVMDFAVAAKTSGLSLSDFTKALEESGGAFNKLGSNATDGAANFSQLINSVRSATASVGNLGLSNEQMAVFTAQQLKIAVAQGMKGRQAQDFVIKNSRELGKELDDLASRTGKSVLEMAQAATKLAQDPIVASFVNSAKSMAPEVAAAVQKIAANYTALFGEAGAKIAEDAVKSAFGGLPFSITKTGQSLLLAGSAIYEEVQRQANMAKMGMDVTEADRERLNSLVLQEVDARGDQLRMMANLDGAAGESARQILSMAAEARRYNTEEAKRERERGKIAKDFRAATNELQANIQQLAVPFLQLINGINWNLMFDILNTFVNTVQILLKPFELLGNILGASGVGSVIGALLGIATVVSGTSFVFLGMKKAILEMTNLFKTVSNSMGRFGQMIDTVSRPDRMRQMRATGMSPLDIQNQLTREDRAKARTRVVTEQEQRAGFTRLTRAEEAAGAPAVPGRKETAWTKVTGAVEKFGTAITSITAAVAGSALSMWGQARLAEDANDKMGQLLVTIGDTTTAIALWGGLFLQLIPALKTGITTFAAYIAAKGGVLAMLSSFGVAIKSLAVGMAPLLIPLAKFIAVAAAIALVAYGLYKAFTALWEAAKWVGEAIGNVASSVAQGFSELWDIMTKPFTMLYDWFKDTWVGKMLGLSSNKTEKAGPARDTKTAQGTFIGNELVRPGQPLSEKQMAVIGMAKSMGNTYSPEIEAQYKKQLGASPNDQRVIGGGKEVMQTQSAAVDASVAKADSDKAGNQKMVALLEDIKGANEASLGVQARGVAVADSSNRYLRDQRMYS